MFSTAIILGNTGAGSRAARKKPSDEIVANESFPAFVSHRLSTSVSPRMSYAQKNHLNVSAFSFFVPLQAIAVILDEFPMITLPYAEHYFAQDFDKVSCCCYKGEAISQFSFASLGIKRISKQLTQKGVT